MTNLFANADDTQRQRLLAAGYHEERSPFSGTPYWRAPDGTGGLSLEEALNRLERATIRKEQS